MTGIEIRELREAYGMSRGEMGTLVLASSAAASLYRWESKGDQEVKVRDSAQRILNVMASLKYLLSNADAVLLVGYKIREKMMVRGHLYGLYVLLHEFFTKDQEHLTTSQRTEP